MFLKRWELICGGRKINKVIFAFDIDGTIVNSKECFFKSVLDIFSELKNRNIEYIFVTARPIQAVYWIIKALKSKPLGIVSYNGAVFVTRDNEITISARIDLEKLRNIIIACSQVKGSFRIQSVSKGIINIGKKKNWPQDYLEYYRPNKYLNVADIVQLTDAIKLSYWGSNEDCQLIRKECLSLSLPFFENKPGLLEVVPQNVDKGTGIRNLFDKLSLSNVEIISIGDGLVDIPMFKCSKTSFTFKTSQDEVKNSATHILKDPINDGLYEFYKFIKEKNYEY